MASPTEPPSALPPLPSQPAGVEWPTEAWPMAGTGPDVDEPRLEALLDHLFDDQAVADLGHTHALALIHGGRLVCERYGTRFLTDFHHLAGIEADDITPETPLISWSMAKSMNHALVGMLVADGLVDITDRAPVPAWDDPADPRHGITWDHLLQMRPGLQWAEEYYDGDAVSDVIEMLYGDSSQDMAGFAAGFPLVAEPGSDEAYNYSSGTSNIIARCVQSVVGGGEPGMRQFLQDRLFGPLGMTSATPSFDGAGTFVASSYVDATARDFARFGLLYLRDGVWEGRRLLPEGWVDHGRRPRSWDEHMFHGAQWWNYADARGTFLAHGFEGQRILCVPTLDLVLVRLGVTQAGQREALDQHLDAVVGCFEG